VRTFRALVLVSAAILCLTPSHAQTNSRGAPKIILPPRLAAGQAATLAVLSAEGKLQPNVGVSFPDGTQVTTDATGRAVFTAPSAEGVLLAQLAETSGAESAVALVVPPLPPGNLQTEARITSFPPWVALRRQFAVYGAGFRGDADGNLARIAGKQALVLAASPVSLVLLPNPQAEPGSATLVIQPGTGQVSATLILLDIALEPPLSVLPPGKRESIDIRVLGTDAPREVELRNLAPDVLKLRGDNFQRLKTSGGANNAAPLEVQGRRQGDFSLDVRLISAVYPADIEAAATFLTAAASHADGPTKQLIADWTAEPLTSASRRDAVSKQIEKELPRTKNTDIAALLRAALTALGGSSE
jgi:hypothetical protein